MRKNTILIVTIIGGIFYLTSPNINKEVDCNGISYENCYPDTTKYWTERCQCNYCHSNPK
jgi:hypothetical protein